MVLTVEQEAISPEVTVLHVRGRLALGRDCQSLENTIRDLKSSGVKSLILDASGLEYIDSAGLGVLAMSMAMMRGVGGGFRLAAPSERVVEALKITQLDKIIPVSKDIESAQKEL